MVNGALLSAHRSFGCLEANLANARPVTPTFLKPNTSAATELSREVEMALPDEPTPAERRAMATGFALTGGDMASLRMSPAMPQVVRGDERKHHAHIMLSACTAREDLAIRRRHTIRCFARSTGCPNKVNHERARLAKLINKTRLGARGASPRR